MYEALLEQIVRWRQERNLEVPPAATPEQIESLRQRTAKDLGSKVPPAYEAFLSRVNGIDNAGLIVYASETTPAGAGTQRTLPGFVETNRIWRSDDYHQTLLVFAESGQNLYVYDTDERRYQILDRATHGVQRSFVAFDVMLLAALAAHRP